MKHRTLLRRLRRLSIAATAEVPRINWGGCGVMAAIVGKRLQEFGILCEVVTYVRKGWGGAEPASVVRNRLSMEEINEPYAWDRKGLDRRHLALRFVSNGKVYTWDSHGLVRGSHWFGSQVDYDNNVLKKGFWPTDPEFGSGMTVAECEAISSKQAGWNRDFNREYIPTLEELADAYLVHGKQHHILKSNREEGETLCALLSS